LLFDKCCPNYNGKYPWCYKQTFFFPSHTSGTCFLMTRS
jgi:hypothetical protein